MIYVHLSTAHSVVYSGHNVTPRNYFTHSLLLCHFIFGFRQTQVSVYPGARSSRLQQLPFGPQQFVFRRVASSLLLLYCGLVRPANKQSYKCCSICWDMQKAIVIWNDAIIINTYTGWLLTFDGLISIRSIIVSSPSTCTDTVCTLFSSESIQWWKTFNNVYTSLYRCNIDMTQL